MRTIDRNWHWVTPVAFVVITVVYRVIESLAHSALLLQHVAKGDRLSVYNAVAAATGALVGFALTALAILIALPDTPKVEELQTLRAWEVLPRMILNTAAILTLALVFSIYGLAEDTAVHQDRTLEGLFIGSVASGLLGLATSGLAFALVIRNLHRQRDQH
jgi:hypothetical protein